MMDWHWIDWNSVGWRWMDWRWAQWALVALAPIVAFRLAMAVFRSWSISSRREQVQKKDEGRETEYLSWREAVRAHGGMQPVFCPIPLEAGEQCYSFDNAVALYVPTDPHEHHGDGVLFDTLPGQPVGGGWSIMDCFYRVQFAGRGRLCVTDRSISFCNIGSRQEIQLEDVHTVAASCSCLLVGSEQMDRPLLFQNVNGQRLRDVIHFVIGRSGTGVG